MNFSSIKTFSLIKVGEMFFIFGKIIIFLLLKDYFYGQFGNKLFENSAFLHFEMFESYWRGTTPTHIFHWQLYFYDFSMFFSVFFLLLFARFAFVVEFCFGKFSLNFATAFSCIGSCNKFMLFFFSSFFSCLLYCLHSRSSPVHK